MNATNIEPLNGNIDTRLKKLNDGQYDCIIPGSGGKDSIFASHLLKNKYSSMECKTDAYEEYNYKLDKQHDKMVWTHDKVDSWYRNKDGRVITNSPWRLVDYWNFTKEPKANDYLFN